MQNQFLFLVETLSLYIHHLLALLSISHIADAAGYRNHSNGYYYLLALILTFILQVFEKIYVIPFVFAIITILFTALLTGYATDRSLWLRITASTLFYLSICFIQILISGFFKLLWPFITAPIPTLTSTLFIFLFYLYLRSHKQDLALLDTKQLWVLFLFSTCCFIILFVLSQFLQSNSDKVMRYAILLTLLFCGFLLLGLSITLHWINRSQRTSHEQGLYSLTNEMLENNYRQLFANQQVIAKQVHDFNNHLLALQNLINDSTQAAEYISELLDASSQQAVTCQSGNEIIDAIINSKQNEASIHQIHFTYNIHLPVSLSINSIDICTVLANLLDNAVEACLKLDNSEDRFIHVSIGPKYNYIFFRVENSVNDNPIGEHRPPATTKKDRSRPHGLGLKNVLDTVKRYNGALEHDYKAHRFAAIAMMQLPPEDLQRISILEQS